MVSCEGSIAIFLGTTGLVTCAILVADYRAAPDEEELDAAERHASSQISDQVDTLYGFLQNYPGKPRGLVFLVDPVELARSNHPEERFDYSETAHGVYHWFWIEEGLGGREIFYLKYYPPVDSEEEEFRIVDVYGDGLLMDHWKNDMTSNPRYLEALTDLTTRLEERYPKATTSGEHKFPRSYDKQDK